MTAFLPDSPPWWISEASWRAENRQRAVHGLAVDSAASPAVVDDVLRVLAEHGSYSDVHALNHAARCLLRQHLGDPDGAVIAALTWQRSRRPNLGDGFHIVAMLPINQRSRAPERAGDHLVVRSYELAAGAELWQDHQRGQVGRIVGSEPSPLGLQVYARIDRDRPDLAAAAVADRLTCSAGFRVQDATEGSDATWVGRAVVHEVTITSSGTSLMDGATVRLGVMPPPPPPPAQYRRQYLRSGGQTWAMSAPTGRIDRVQ